MSGCGVRRFAVLLLAAHPGPVLVVTSLSVLLARVAGLDGVRTGLVVFTVLTGQLSIGWSNDLLDAERDRRTGRADKPLARGELSSRTVQVATALALGLSVLASAACGWAAGLVHLVLVVGSGWAYNLGLKASVWSFVPYAIAFGSLPHVASLAAVPPSLAPLWLTGNAGLLGVGAHLLNVLPDLADDEATGVRGLPHALGEAGLRTTAAATVVAATVVTLVGTSASPLYWIGAMTAAVLGGGAAMTGRGRRPFAALVAVALLDVGLLVIRTS